MSAWPWGKGHSKGVEKSQRTCVFKFENRAHLNLLWQKRKWKFIQPEDVGNRKSRNITPNQKCQWVCEAQTQKTENKLKVQRSHHWKTVSTALLLMRKTDMAFPATSWPLVDKSSWSWWQAGACVWGRQSPLSFNPPGAVGMGTPHFPGPWKRRSGPLYAFGWKVDFPVHSLG